MTTNRRNRAHDAAAYAFDHREVVLLDTNVWLSLYPAPSPANRPRVAAYSSAFKRMQAAGTSLAMDPIVLGEYLRVYCNIEWRALRQRNSAYRRYKTFRRSSDFAVVSQRATASAQLMLRHCTRSAHPFDKIDVQTVFSEFSAGRMDFNDGLLTETCRLHGWTLVTDDRDFTTGGVDVVTANPKLVRACNPSR